MKWKSNPIESKMLVSLVQPAKCTFFLFFEKETSLSVMNNENRETKLKVHEGHTKSKGGGGGSAGAPRHLN